MHSWEKIPNISHPPPPDPLVRIVDQKEVVVDGFTEDLQTVYDRETSSQSSLKLKDSTETSPFVMKLTTDIPHTVVAGTVMSSPIKVVFSRTEKSLPVTEHVWVYASLVDANTGEVPKKDVLLGQRADSVHLFDTELYESQDDFAYSEFSHLSISAPGRYKLRLNAIDMNG